MKKLYSTFIVVVLSATAMAQGFVNKYYSTPNFDAQSYDVVSTSYGYIMAGISVDTIHKPNGYFTYTVMGIDTLGNKLFQKNYGDSSYTVGAGWASLKYLQKVGESYYSVINKIYGSNPSNSFFKLNEWGDTLWTRDYMGDAVDSILVIDNFTKTYSGGFILGGRAWNANSNSGDVKVVLINIDSLGTVVWKKKYNLLTSIGAESISSILQDSVTKKIFFMGYRGYTVYKSVFCTVDSAGNNITTKYINEPYGGVPGSIKQLHDGNFIVAGSYNTANSVGGFVMQKSTLRKLDVHGNTLWHKEFGAEGGVNGSGTIEVLAGDTLIVGGATDTTYAKGLGFNDMFQLCKIAPNGTIIWCTQVDINPPNTCQDVFHGLALAKDGGYVMTGFFTCASPNPFLLIKLDANGCVQTNCRATALAEEQPSVEFVLYPNPASNEINVSYNITSAATLTLTNVLGQVVQSIVLTSLSTTINANALPCGVYIATLYPTNATVTQQKIIIYR